MKSGILETKYGLVNYFEEKPNLYSIDTLTDHPSVYRGIAHQVKLKAIQTSEGWSFSGWGTIYRLDICRPATKHCDKVIKAEILRCLTGVNLRGKFNG